MAKRPTVEVDEDYLKEIMAGGASHGKKEQQPKPVVEQPPPESSGVEVPVKEEEETTLPIEAKEPVKPARKKREVQDYETAFLERKANVPRRQTYINAELYDKINSFLPVIAGHGFGITSYINNIMAHHLELYKDDINELYERKIKKPL
jgi:hypothetical protein